MKKILYIIICALSALTAAAQQPQDLDILPTKKIEANPINIAAVLIQANDTAAITSTLIYYGYTPSTPLTPDTSKPHTWTHPNNSTITYSLSDPATLKDLTIEVTSHGSTKDKENLLLEDLNFKKVGDAFEQKNIGFTTHCTFAPHGTLVLKRLPKAP